MSKLTYGGLDEALRSVGFSVRIAAEPRAKIYEHEAGALIALPILSDEDEVLPRHLTAARGTLEAYGIPDPTVPKAQRQGA